ncbi:acyl carrier protein [Quisquiliibacterium transsilvanicum]|uniref:Acyl carrier protein n=1 Tax=Quisquiliibacterium transsilvanicum TaxID=1549638 RepID=A0A7W8HH69_9BURK|nr:acyl carrier protein [Quisquiliibacterium transsilvanicum]MBB5271386.1 acyl carrier protein [Quisquiliibacterium transsilvanicum]
MDEQTLKRRILEILMEIAPEVEPAEIRPERTLRSQVDLDSMDWLNFRVALHQQLQVEIPEADYQKLVTLDDLIRYLQAKIGPG